MGKFNEYSQKATPADNDTMMIYDAAAKANKLSPFSGIWNWIVGKLTNAVINKLETSNKSVIGALNELNSKPLTAESDDLNNVSGGLAIYHWKLQTANTPRTENLSTASSGIVFSYLESEAWAVQFGMIPANKNWYVRVKSSGEWSRWEEKSSKTLIITIAGSTDSTGNIKINVPNSFSRMPYVVTNIRDDLRYPYVVVISGWTQNQINFRIRNASDNAAIINTELPTFQCMLIGK